MAFTQRVAMKLTPQQFETDLITKLKDLGYSFSGPIANNAPWLITQYASVNDLVGTNEDSGYKSLVIDEYNPELFLAIAAINNNPKGIVGEWWKYIGRTFKNNFTSNKLYKCVKPLDTIYSFSDDLGESNGFRYNEKKFVKASLDEILNHFTNKSLETLYTKTMVRVSKQDFKKLYEIACDGWKETLINHISKDFFFTDYIEFSIDFIEKGRKACTTEQLPVFEELFGKANQVNVTKPNNKRPWFGNAENGHIQPRIGGNYKDISFLLSDGFDWEIKTDNLGCKVLVPTLKNK